MKRSILILGTAVLSMLGSPLLAAETETGSSQDMMPMVQEMHAHMQAMKATMKQIRETNDPQERKKLTHEHMQSMNKGMAMMAKLDQHEMKKGAAGQHQAQCKQSDEQCQQMQTMNSEQYNMQERMQMMRMMMQQMMDHQMAQEEQAK